jgi:hypothetical protein
MKYLAIDKNPYFISYALFEYETKKLLKFGTVNFRQKDENERLKEIWVKIDVLLDELNPNGVLTHWLDLRNTLKRDLEHTMQVKTILRKLCIDKEITYNEFRTNGWEKRIIGLKKPSPRAKLKIAQEYSKDIESVEIANAIILGEGVVWNRLQIGRI